jgi:hypothetical protein
MPCYIGQEMPEWDEYREWKDSRGGEQPLSLVKFIEPSEAKTTVLHGTQLLVLNQENFRPNRKWSKT